MAQEQNEYFALVFNQDEEVAEDIDGIPQSTADMNIEMTILEGDTKHRLLTITELRAWIISILKY